MFSITHNEAHLIFIFFSLYFAKEDNALYPYRYLARTNILHHNTNIRIVIKLKRWRMLYILRIFLNKLFASGFFFQFS